jgi:hypothetical protein
LATKPVFVWGGSTDGCARRDWFPGSTKVAQSKAVKYELHVKGQSFLVQIRFRENNCWQGMIQWLEGRTARSFRSLREMILLIDEALDKADTGEDKPETRTWEL